MIRDERPAPSRVLRRGLLPVAAAALVLAGCSTYLGGSRPIDPSDLAAPGWIAATNVPYIAQQEDLDCGVAALAMMLLHWKAVQGIEEVRAACPPDPERGTEAGALRDFAKVRGLQAFVIEGDPTVLLECVVVDPCRATHDLAAPGHDGLVGRIAAHVRAARSSASPD